MRRATRLKEAKAMTRLTMLLAVAFLGSALGGCNNAKSPATVAKDVNSAEQSAAENTAKAEEKAADKIAAANKDVGDEQRDAMHVASTQDERVAETNAEGNRKIALAKCEALSGEQQKACKDQAKAAYDLAIAAAKQQRASTDPKP